MVSMNWSPIGFLRGLSALAGTVACVLFLSACNTNHRLLEQPEPARTEEAVAAIDEILRYAAFGVGHLVEITPTTLRWQEQTHTPKLGWRERTLAFREIRSVECGRGVSGWTVTVDCVTGSTSWEVEKPAHAGRLRAALLRMAREP